MEITYYTFLLLPLLYATYRLWRLGHRPKNYPPGPPTLPVLGNIHLMVKDKPHLQFQKWAQEYGPVYSLILGTKTMVVLSDDQVVKDLLDRKSANTSARPDLYTGQTLMSGGKRMVMMTFRWPTFHDPLLQTLFHNLDNYVRLNMTGGAALADFFPILRYLPTWLSPHKHEALAHYSHEIAMYTTLYRRVKSALLANPDARSCVCKDIIALQAQENYTDEYTSHIPGQLWEAGSDTTSTQLYGFIQALLLYPDIQAKGQAEIDAVIGHDRMPTLDDMTCLPYVRACVKETLRWLPAAILGAFPHATSEDDVYKGYRIPKGAIIMLNTWTIHRDPARYANPTVFNADRFLGDTSSSAESATSIDVSRRDHFGFGAGRRICPGMNVADRSLLLGIARIFWAFEVKPKIGDDGVAKMPVQDDFVPGFVAIPKPFDVREIVRREWEMAKEGLGDDGQFLKGSVRMNGMK
ncbi:cytochrome P450 [Paraphoma chrysanthemicola]|uniref:Cytochrome P450 n=1 Tax=Paraphoma chrysanthemicola TaxID=798071 RepID=A0A8K0RHB1_9PLEO|nr:cytochrome P450 [Paraphoma chrysanthemicola]